MSNAMRNVVPDLLYAWRALRQKPGFFLASLAILTLGIGANITVFSMVNGILLRPLPFGDRTDRLVTLHSHLPLVQDNLGWGDSEVSYADFLELRSIDALEGVAGYLERNFVLSGDDAAAERVQGGSVTPGLFKTLGIDPILGRHFLDEEAATPTEETVVMLTHGLWQRRYGADPAIVGKPIMVNSRLRTVIGVMPPGFKFPERDELYLPYRWDISPRTSRSTDVVALLRNGATLAEAQAQASAVAARLEQAFPASNRGYGVTVSPIRDSYVDEGDSNFSVTLMAAVAFLLLIMCANLANLMLVRGAARQRELAVRAAMGASRGRLISLTLSESLLLAVPGTLLGVLSSRWAVDWMIGSFPETLPYWVHFDIDTRVTMFAVGVGLFTTLAVGVLPSLRAARANAATDLKEGGRGLSLSTGAHRMQWLLALTQVALCFGLLVGADLMVNSFLAIQHVDLGFDDRSLLSMRAYLGGDAYNDVRVRAVFYRQAADALAQIPGVAAASAITGIPGDDGGAPVRVTIDDRASAADDIGAQMLGITPRLFATLDRPLIEGRTFTDLETEDQGSRVALINGELARRLWPGQSALDRRVGIRNGDDIQWLRIVGVAPDFHYEEIGEETAQSRLNVYVPYALSPSRTMGLIVRGRVAAEELLTPVRQRVAALSPTFPIYELMPMRERRRYTSWEQEFFGDLMASFAVAALLLACLGVYALMAYAVSRRTHEIGVRLSLGARPADVVTMLLKETARVGSAGLLIGLLFAMAIARALTGFLYGVQLDASLFVTMAAPLAAAIFFATWLPARRAARVEPTIALRDE
jgi:putative ABC transport system permease protein